MRAIASAVLATIVVAVPFAGSASAIPAVDAYTPRPPSASGEQSAGVPEQGESGQLPPATEAQLQQSKDGSTLGTIATSDELGAPPPAKLDAAVASSEARSLPEATGSALTAPWAIAVLLALIAITAFAILRRRQDPAE